MAERKKQILFIVFLVAAFFFRLAYGLFSEFWFEDELQIYLIGLKFYTTGHFPFFGPDIVYTQSQIPGALQGLLAGGPFFLCPVPEAPYLLLNLLTFGSLCFFAVYIRKRIPGVPGWFVWSWLLTGPWTMNYSTHVINPSYVLPASIFFFTGFLESVPKLKTGFINLKTSLFIMGFSFFWIFQLHQSWVLLLPFIFLSLFYTVRTDRKTIFFFLLGCLVTVSLVIPAWLVFGAGAGQGAGGSIVVFNPRNLREVITVLARYLSFASMELPRFLGTDTPSRLETIRIFYPAAPFIVFATLAGLVQPVYLAAGYFLKNPSKDFTYLKNVALFTFLLTWLSFLFSVKGPSSHTFYVVFPVVTIYSVYCWMPLFRRRWFVILMSSLLVSGVITHSVLGYRNFKTRSLYLNREKPLEAIQKKDYRLLGERRSYDWNP